MRGELPPRAPHDGADALSKLDVEGTLGKVGKTVSSGSLAVDEDTSGGTADQEGQEGKGGKEG